MDAAESWMSGRKKDLLKTFQNDFSEISSPKFNSSFASRFDQTLNPSTKTLEIDSMFEKTSYTSKNSRKSLFDGYKEMSELCYQFLDNVDIFGTPDKVCDLMNSFVSSCNTALEIHTQLNLNDKNWLENERSTWRLLYALFESRLHYMNEDEDLAPENDLDIMKNFFQNNDIIRECQLVIDWLEECAASSENRNERPKLSHFMDKTIAWENTLHQIQVPNLPYSSSRALVTAMDPDAPQRQKKQLHDLDTEDEIRLLEQIFHEIRCGRLRKALELCTFCGHKWRAAVLQGWMLFNDPNYKSSESENVISSFGNQNRDIWKMCAWKLTEESTCSSMWKAIIAVFCGNLSAILPFCKTWDDLLWAYLKVFIDVKVEAEIRNNSLKKNVELPEQYWEFKFTLEEIFEEIAGYTNNNIRVEAAKPERVIQKLLITNQIPTLIDTLANWCQVENANPHLVRFAAHVVICFRNLSIQCDQNHTESILLAYVKGLIKQADAKLVAYYLTMLPKQMQIEYYSQYLASVSDENERIQCLEIAENCGLPVDEITKHVVQTIRNKVDDSEEGESLNLISGVSKQDEEKIVALDLIMHYKHQRDEALWETNALIRYFLCQRNLQAANYAFSKIPDDSVEVILNNLSIDEMDLQHNPELVPNEIFASIREYFCYKVYLNAEMKFADWFQYYHKMEPLKPRKPPQDSQFVQKVGYEQELNAYSEEYNKWKFGIDEQTKSVKAHLYNVMMFPDGGWLVEKRFMDDSGRINQMNSLRKLYIPKIIIMLHNVLDSMKMYDECLRLADVITSENHKIYAVYSSQDLAEILNKICESSVQFLRMGKDPFGLQVTL